MTVQSSPSRARRLCAASYEAAADADPMPVLLAILQHHAHQTDALLADIATCRVSSHCITPPHARALIGARDFVRRTA